MEPVSDSKVQQQIKSQLQPKAAAMKHTVLKSLENIAESALLLHCSPDFVRPAVAGLDLDESQPGPTSIGSAPVSSLLNLRIPKLCTAGQMVSYNGVITRSA